MRARDLLALVIDRKCAYSAGAGVDSDHDHEVLSVV
jgi:hypothetical protein